MVNGFGKRLNESFSKYFSKLNESKFEEFENMTKEPMFTFPNGEYLYVNVDKNKDTIYAGGASNTGVFREFEIDYDFDDTLDGNLNRLYDTIIEERPELLDELDEPNDGELELTTDDMNGGQWLESLNESSDERILNFNRKLAKKIKSELKPGKSKQIAFEDFAGTNDDFIKAAEDAGLTITDRGSYTITVKNPINESLKESVEKFIITKVGDNKYALAKGNPPVVNSRKTVEANSPEEAKEILMKYGYSEDELIVESLLNEKLPHKMVSTLSPKDTGKDYENGIGHEISPKYVKHIKEVDRKRLADVYVLVSYEGDEITIPYLEYNKRVYGEPLQYFIAEIPDYDVTNPEEAHRRGYNRNKSFGYRLEKDDIRDDKSKLDSKRSERGHHFTTEYGKKMDQLNRDFTLRNIDSNNRRANSYDLKSRLKDKYNKNESLKESVNMSNFKSDVYSALGDVMFEYHSKGEDPTPEEVHEALEWFEIKFFEFGYDEEE